MTENTITGISWHERLAGAKAKINEYLSVPYLVYKETGSVKDFVAKGVNLFVFGIAAGAGIYSPEIGEKLPTAVRNPLRQHPILESGKSEVENYKLFQGEIVWERPTGSSYRTKPFVEKFDGPIAQLGYVHPALPRYDLARLLDLTSKAERARSLARKENHGIYASYNTRYKLFCQESGLIHDHSYPKYLALLFIEDIAKKNSMRAIRGELYNLQPGNPTSIVAPPTESLEKAVDYVTRKMAKPLYHLGYLTLIDAIRREFVEKHMLDESQRSILGDIAFFRRGELEMGYLTKLLTPIMEAVGRDRFDDAKDYLNFLESNFKGNFPQWRRDQIHGVRFPTFRALVEDTYFDDEEAIREAPKLYQPLIQAEIDQIDAKAGRLQKIEAARNEKIRRRALASRLLFESIVIVSSDQSRKYKWMEFNPDLAPSYENPLIIHYKPVISDLDKIGHLKDWVYIGDKKQDDQKIPVLVTDYGVWHPITTVFTSLLYQDILTKESVEKAFGKLKEAGEVSETDSLVDILRLGLRRSVRSYKERMGQKYLDDKLKQLIHQKLALIDDFVDQFEVETGNGNDDLKGY